MEESLLIYARPDLNIWYQKGKAAKFNNDTDIDINNLN